MLLGQASYLRSGGKGAWRQDLPDAGRTRAPSLRSALAGAGLRPAGSQWVADGKAAVPVVEALGLADPGTLEEAGVTGDVAPDGTLRQLAVSFDNVLGSWALQCRFAATPDREPITKPADVVRLFQQPDVYLLLHPEGWTSESIGQNGETFDIFTTPGAEQLIVFCQPGSGGRAGWVKTGRDHYTKEWKAKPTAKQDVTVGDVTWSLTEWEQATAFDRPVHGILAATMSRKHACDIQGLGLPGSGDESRATFSRVLETITFLD